MSSRLRPPKPRDHRHAPLLLWPGGRHPTATRASTRPLDADGTHPWDVIVSEGPGEEVLRGEDAVAHKPASINWTIASRETGVASIGKPPPAISGLAQQRA